MARDTEKIRCKWILAIALMVAVQASITGGLSTAEVSAKKPHVILIVADDLGWNDVSWNNPDVVMPNLDSLAKGGVIMNQAYVLPQCTPTRTALLTGRYPHTLGLQGSAISSTEPEGVPLSATMLPQIIKDGGQYSTHAIGKWHLGFCDWAYTPTSRGFDTFYGFYSGGQDYYTHKKGTPHGPLFDKKIEYLDLRNNTAIDNGKDGVYSTGLFGSVAEDIVRGNNPNNPMFLYLAFQAVHSPLQVPAEYLSHYSNVQDSDRKSYLGMVTAMDEAVGRVVTALKETGHYENSVIIFTSDNGGLQSEGGSNWPLRGRKGTLWEGGTKAAAFAHSPFITNHGDSDQLVHVSDWYSTIAGITGATVPNDVEGVNQWDALVGISSPPRDSMIYNIYDHDKFSASVRVGNYKMMVGNVPTMGWETSQTSSASAGNAPDPTYTLWSTLRRKTSVNFEPRERQLANTYFPKNGKIRLFNIQDDPEERQEISSGNDLILQQLLKYLFAELEDYVPENVPVPDPRGHPVNWNNVWSPGWCVAKQ